MKLEPENKTEKLKYEPASIEIIRFETEDILTTSGIGDPGNDPGFDLPIDPFTP